MSSLLGDYSQPLPTWHLLSFRGLYDFCLLLQWIFCTSAFLIIKKWTWAFTFYVVKSGCECVPYFISVLTCSSSYCKKLCGFKLISGIKIMPDHDLPYFLSLMCDDCFVLFRDYEMWSLKTPAFMIHNADYTIVVHQQFAMAKSMFQIIHNHPTLHRWWSFDKCNMVDFLIIWEVVEGKNKVHLFFRDRKSVV